MGGGEVLLKPKAQAGPSMGAALWCAICQVTKQHAMDNYHLLQKFIQTPQQLFCDFCKYVDHYERHCRSYEMMMKEPLLTVCK